MLSNCSLQILLKELFLVYVIQYFPWDEVVAV